MSVAGCDLYHARDGLDFYLSAAKPGSKLPGASSTGASCRVIPMTDTAETNQHYVSQFVLRGFHTGNEAQIWAFDKITSRSFTTAIDKIASEHGFYNIDGSAELDVVIGKFEKATAPIISQIRERKSLASVGEYESIWPSGFTALDIVSARQITD
jgi:hypothetical protein